MWVCVCLCVCVCPDSLETVEVIIIKLGTVTASDMRMHHVFIILTLTFIQGHTDLNYEDNNFWIISETIQAMPIKFSVKIVRQKVYMTTASPMTTSFTSASQTLLFNLRYLGQCLSYYIQTWHGGRFMDAVYAHDLDLDARSQWVSKGIQISIECSQQLNKQ